MNYVALRRLKVGSSYRERGELVPEAASWKNVRAYISQGWIRPQLPEEEHSAKRSAGYPCEACGQEFKNQRGLRIHRTKQHREVSLYSEPKPLPKELEAEMEELEATEEESEDVLELYGESEG